MEHEVGPELRGSCRTIYIMDAAIDTVESSTSAEISFDLGLPASLPSRDWCKGCKQPCGGAKR